MKFTAEIFGFEERWENMKAAEEAQAEQTVVTGNSEYEIWGRAGEFENYPEIPRTHRAYLVMPEEIKK